MAASRRSGLGMKDLERELSCSICTELLYQPLTLLDCLHTFCGSCLKEWFATQASRRRTSQTSPQFTCPACRAAVRETRPNATVTTLLDMFLTAHPDRVRSSTEKDEIAQRYNPGDSVFPAEMTRFDSSSDNEDEDDRRMLEEVRQLSLQDSEARARRQNRRRRQAPGDHIAGNIETDNRGQSGRTRRRRGEGHATRRQAGARGVGSDHNQSEDSDAPRTRRIEHQSSLRSLLILSDAETMEEEILRQILEEGLLDGIDLERIEPGQEEEISERIADAYRRRHRLPPSSRRRDGSQAASGDDPRPRAQSQSGQRTTTSTTAREVSSNPRESQLLVPRIPPTRASGERRSSVDHGNTQRRPSPRSGAQPASADTIARPAARSSSDLTAERTRRPQAPTSRTTRAAPFATSRRATEPEGGITTTWLSGSRDRNNAQQPVTSRPTDPPPSVTPPLLSAPISPPASTAAEPVSSVSVGALHPPGSSARSNREGRSRPSSSRSNASNSSANMYAESSIACERCNKPNIQYDVYMRCLECNDGKYNICLRCYRLGRGCLEWAGFKASATAKCKLVLRQDPHLPAPSSQQGHILHSYKYLRPRETAQRALNEGQLTTSDDPARRKQSGVFCDICHFLANDCYWQCSQCNEGDWGYCNRCVNQGKCCTHALLPLRRVLNENTNTADAPIGNTTPAQQRPRESSLGTTETFSPLSMSTKCDICTQPIQPTKTRFHCPQCNDGDYDICPNCYLKLVATGKISKDNGHYGWRRCLRGHRMVIVGFQNYEDGQRRVVVRDLVGGCALKDDQALQPASHFPTSATVASLDREPGDWSWTEGAAERRKKASRVRAGTGWSSPHSWNTTSNGNNGAASEQSHSSSSSGTTTASSTRRFPPDGGVGMIAQARWAWYPEDDVVDELMFPRGAEITEAENINDDWFWGCYAGATGLFPGAHVNIIGEIV